jgi:NADH dehydrogenase
VGGGFGGLYAARALAGTPVSITLIDKRNYHLFRPLLYQVATGLLSADEISGPLRSILSRQNNIDVLLGEVTGVDMQKRVVRLEQHDVPYDFLILATGVFTVRGKHTRRRSLLRSEKFLLQNRAIQRNAENQLSFDQL